MRGLRVFLRLGVISFAVMFGGHAMRLGGIVMVFGGVVMCVLGHYFSLLLRSGRHMNVSDHALEYAFELPFRRGWEDRKVSGRQKKGAELTLRAPGTQTYG
jgi:hypothetical protein